MHSYLLSGFHMSNFGDGVEGYGCQTQPHFRTPCFVKGWPEFFFSWFKGGGGVEYVEHTKISGMEFWKEFCFPKLRGAYFFQRNWGQVFFSRVLSSPSWAIFQVVYRHLGREQDRDSPIQNRKPCSKEMVITRKERTHSIRCAPYQL